MISSSTGSNRKVVSQNTRNKISKSLQNAYARNEAMAKNLGFTKKNAKGKNAVNVLAFRRARATRKNLMKELMTRGKAPKTAKKATKKNKTPVASTFNPFNDNIFGSASAPVSANAMKSAAKLFGTTPEGKKTNEQRAKMSAAQKESAATSSWMANIKKVQNSMKVPRPEAMVIASEKRKEKAGFHKSKNNNAALTTAKNPATNVNLLGLSNLSISNKKAAPVNPNFMSELGL